MLHVKRLFQTPKRTLITFVCAVAVLIIAGTGTVFATESIAKNTSIGADHAQNFAFVDAGIDPAKATDIYTEFEFEQGQFVYEVNFIADGTEYEYWIKASDGSVVKKDLELIDPVKETKPIETNNTQPEKTTTDVSDTNKKNTASTGSITLETAKEIALTHAGLQSGDVTFSKAKLDHDDGQSVYEIEFYKNGIEYDYEIDVNSGTILEYNSEYDD